MRRLVTVLFTVLVAAPARAGLPGEGWPQLRRDASRSGEASGPVPARRVRERWIAPTGPGLNGEPAVHGCTAAVLDAAGTVRAFNARNGEALWTHAREWAVPPSGVVSALAFDDDGQLHAGVPADPLLTRSWRALIQMYTALFSRAIDENEFPAGTDLAAALTPTYIRTLPPNPITGDEMVHSDTPSPGDYRYRQENSGAGYHLAIWGSDGGLLDFGAPCSSAQGGGPAPDWPLSEEKGGSATSLMAADGELVSQSLRPGNALVITPGIGDDGVDWAMLEDSSSNHGGAVPNWWSNELTRTGRLRLADGEAPGGWDALGWGPTRGGSARAADGSRFLSRGPSLTASVLMGQAVTLSTAVESYSIDNNAYPPSGDLVDDVIPVYLACMPSNLFTLEELVHSDVPSPGNYRYEADATLTSYTLTFWNARGEVALVFDTGSFLQPAEDEPAAVERVLPDGSAAWHVDVAPDAEADVSPPLLLRDGAVVVGTSRGDVIALEPDDGAERWRADVGGPVSLALARRPGGGVVALTAGGWAIALDGSGAEDWSWWVGAPVAAAPTTGSDGGVLIADLDGTLTALDADGSLRWRSFLGGPTRAGLTTSPVLVDGWVHVGRADGTLVAATPEDGSASPEDPFPLLATGEKGPSLAVFDWSTAPTPADPGAHWHVLRWRDELFGLGEEISPAHPSNATSVRDETATGALLFYSVLAVDCGENASGPSLY